MVVQFPGETWYQIVSLLSRTDQKTLLLVSKSFNSLSRPFVDEIVYFPLSGYQWQKNTRREQCAEAVREHALHVMRSPMTACDVRELRVRGQSDSPFVVGFDAIETRKVAGQIEELMQVLQHAVNLHLYSCRSYSPAISLLTCRANLLPKLQVCSISSLSALARVEVCRFHTLRIEDGPYISTVFDCLWTYPGPPTVFHNAKYSRVLDLELGSAFNLTEEPLDLSRFPALKRLKLSSAERGFPFHWLEGQRIGIISLVIQGQSVRLGDDFESFLSRLLLEKLCRLSIRVATFDYQPSHRGLSFCGLRSLELAVDTHAGAILRHNFPSLTKIFFSTCGRNEVSKFYESFIDRFSSHLQDVLVQRRTPLGYHTALACHVGSLYEVLSERAVDAILQCHQLRNFSLEGRVYFPLKAWDRWCVHDYTRNLQRAYFARPNALVLAEKKYMVSQTGKPYALLSRFNDRLFLSQAASESWSESSSFDRIAIKRQLLHEIDPEGDFIETYTEDRTVRIANYQLAVEAARHDRCFCGPGEERFPYWFRQESDPSPDNETHTDEADDSSRLENEEFATASNTGLVKFDYVKAVCPQSRENKRRLRKRSRLVYEY